MYCSPAKASSATLAAEPLVQGAWLAPGSHLDLIGSFTPGMREADDDCFRGARIAIDTDEALAKSGDLLGPLSRGVFTPAEVRASAARHRSPLVLRCIEDHLAGVRHPLGVVGADPSLWA